MKIYLVLLLWSALLREALYRLFVTDVMVVQRRATRQQAACETTFTTADVVLLRLAYFSSAMLFPTAIDSARHPPPFQQQPPRSPAALEKPAALRDGITMWYQTTPSAHHTQQQSRSQKAKSEIESLLSLLPTNMNFLFLISHCISHLPFLLTYSPQMFSSSFSNRNTSTSTNAANILVSSPDTEATNVGDIPTLPDPNQWSNFTPEPHEFPIRRRTR